MTKIYYKHMGGENLDGFTDGTNLHMVIEHPFLESRHTFVWRIFSFCLCGTYCRWRLYRGEKMVSEAEVVSWLPIFKFMPPDGIHIGPCRTVPDERGKGYYPYLLRLIVKDTKKTAI